MRVWMAAAALCGMSVGLTGQAPAPPATAAIVRLQALLEIDQARAWRTDIWLDGDELVLRVTPSDPAAERSRLRRQGGTAIEARGRFATDGAVQRLTIRDTERPGLHVARGATVAARTATLALARFGAGAQVGLLAAARARRWTALGGAATIGDEATLTWRPVEGGRERAVWQVRAVLTRSGQPVAYRVSLDPADGSLIDLVRESGPR